MLRQVESSISISRCVAGSNAAIVRILVAAVSDVEVWDERSFDLGPVNIETTLEPWCSQAAGERTAW